MNKRHLLAALLAAALLALSGAGALAATDRTAVPKLTLEAPQTAVPSGSSVDLVLNANLPGFLTLQLLNASGAQALSVCENQELHTKENVVTFMLRTPDKEPLPAGTYTISGEMRSQFGVASKPVSAQITLVEGLETDEDGEETAGSGAAAASKSAESAKSDTSAKSDSKKETSAAAKPAATVAYVSGTAQVGAEGLQIGVGVSDSAKQTDAGYWGLTADASDAEIWAALTRPMMGVDVDERESAYIYDSPEEGRKQLGTVFGVSQGVNVVQELEGGWVLVEAYRAEDGAFMRGYMRKNRLRAVEPNTAYGLVIDKAKQTLTVYRNGERVGSCAISTGLATADYLHRETPAGEYVTVTRRGTIDYASKGFCHYTIRFGGDYHLCEIPATTKNGSDFSILQGSLGQKATRGNVCIAHEASSDGGINAEWIWEMTDTNKRVKVLIFDDKARDQVPTVK